MRKLWLVGLVAVIASPVLAHDFWIQPLQFRFASPQPVPLAMYVGHGSSRTRWGGRAENVVQFRSSGPDGTVDRSAGLRLGATGMDALVPVSRAGAYVFALQSGSVFSQLPFLRFNEYVAAEGITPIARARIEQRSERTDGREIYSRRAKSIVQVGSVDPASAARVTRPVGLSLEIIPARHPLLLGPDRILVTQVLFNGRPLPGALVKITDLARDAVPAATGRTRYDGKVAFRLKRASEWQMNVVWAVRLAGNQRADFSTTFSSLSFASN